MTPAVSTPLYRVVVLACRDHRLAVAGGGVLRLVPALDCPPAVAGTAIAVHLGGDGVDAIVVRVTPDARPPKDIPPAAYAIAPPAGDVDDADAVTVTIFVDAPPRTPPGDDLYLSTDRSGWNPSELRLDRVDVRRWRAQLKLHRGARLAFRVTRGSIATSERDDSGAIPPPHWVTAEGAATARVTIPAWGDIS